MYINENRFSISFILLKKRQGAPNIKRFSITIHFQKISNDEIEAISIACPSFWIQSLIFVPIINYQLGLFDKWMQYYNISDK